MTSTLQGSTWSPSHQPPLPYNHVPYSFGTAPSFTCVVQPSGDPDGTRAEANKTKLTGKKIKDEEQGKAQKGLLFSVAAWWQHAV